MHLVEVTFGRHRSLPSCYSERSHHFQSGSSEHQIINPSAVDFAISRKATLDGIVAQSNFGMIGGLDHTGHLP